MSTPSPTLVYVHVCKGPETPQSPFIPYEGRRFVVHDLSEFRFVPTGKVEVNLVKELEVR